MTGRGIDAVRTRGRSNREIARELFISETVSIHVSAVLAKLHAASRSEAVAEARRLVIALA